MPPPVLQQKSASSLRWVILLAASLLMLSNYFVYDIPASLKDLIRQNMGLDKADFEVGRGGRGGRVRGRLRAGRRAGDFPACRVHRTCVCFRTPILDTLYPVNSTSNV